MSPAPPDDAVRVGVLAIQGDVAEHLRSIAAAGGRPSRIRRPADLNDIDGLILPGGESTTIGMLGGEAGLLSAIRLRVAEGLPVWGTCAGLILLAQDVGQGSPRILRDHRKPIHDHPTNPAPPAARLPGSPAPLARAWARRCRG